MTTSSLLTSLGELPINKKHVFSIVIGAQEHSILITSISAGCSSCTTVKTPKVNLAPGESTDLEITFTPNAAGFQTKMIHINYEEDGKTLKTTLKFTATVMKEA